MPEPTKSLFNIALHHLQGQSPEDVVRYELKQWCKPYGAVSCYQNITRNTNDYHKNLTQLLEALSAAASTLHVMSTTTAQNSGYFNCYVLDENQLFYIGADKKITQLRLQDASLINNFVSKHNNSSKSLHLTAQDIEHIITKKTEERHIPPTRITLEDIKEYYDSQNLYQALQLLSKKDKHTKILLEYIHDTKPERTWQLLILSAAGVSIASVVIYLVNVYVTDLNIWLDALSSMISHWLGQTIILLQTTPLIGIGTHALPLLQAWSNHLLSQARHHDWDEAINLMFQTIKHSLPIAAYVLCYLAAGIMTIPAVALFITGSVLEFCHTLYRLIHDEMDRTYYPVSKGAEYYSHQLKAREMLYDRDLAIFSTKLLANLISTTLIIIWCVYPPSLAIAFTSVCVNFLVHIIQDFTIRQIKQNATEQLHKKLEENYNRYYSTTHRGQQLVLMQEAHEELIIRNSQLEDTIHGLEIEKQGMYERGFKQGFEQGKNTTLQVMGFFRDTFQPKLLAANEETHERQDELESVNSHS